MFPRMPIVKCMKYDPPLFHHYPKFHFSMKKYSYLLILFLMLAFSQAQAGFVEKCTDSTGKVTYTDKGCKGKESAENAYTGTTESTKHKSQLQKTSMAGYKVSEIGFLTEEAVDQCTKQAGKYFADARPEVPKNSEAEFLSVVDRALRGAEVEITLAGVIRYQSDKDSDEQGEKQNHELKIHCTASRSRETEWALVFKDAAAEAKSN
jgi:hypothetical protein